MGEHTVISEHLLVRWLERVDGADLEVFRTAMKRMGVRNRRDADLIEFIDAYSSIDLDRVRALLVPLVARAHALGATGIKYRGLFIPLGLHGAPTTYPQRPRKRMRVIDDRFRSRASFELEGQL